MQNRVIFESSTQRRKFFDLALKKSSLEIWKKLYLVTKIPRQVFDSYKSGKLTIPIERYHILSKFLSSSEKDYFSKRIKLIDDNWGKIKGGKESYQKNKKSFDSGRKVGLKKLIELSQKKTFDVHKISLDKNLAYFIGLWIGDGFTSRYKNHYLTQFVGHKNELIYYQEIICKYVKETFNLNAKIKESKIGNFIRVNIYSKDLFLLLTENIGVPKGRKSHTVLIPEKILNTEREILLSCIAGIYDAEGCVFLDKRKAYTKPYPRLDLHMLNLGILTQIKKIFDEEGIKSSWANTSNDNMRLLVYGSTNVKHFLTKIPLKNPKHLNKLIQFR